MFATIRVLIALLKWGAVVSLVIVFIVLMIIA
jgi:hypothetical protein